MERKTVSLSHLNPTQHKAMATHSSTLDWKIPWTEEPCRLQSMRSQRVGHDWSDLAAAAATLIWSEVAQSCPTLCDPMDCSLQGSSVHGIFQARVLEWVAISISMGSSPTQGSNLGLPHCRQTLYHLSHQGSSIYLFIKIKMWQLIITIY